MAAAWSRERTGRARRDLVDLDGLWEPFHRHRPQRRDLDVALH